MLGRCFQSLLLPPSPRSVFLFSSTSSLTFARPPSSVLHPPSFALLTPSDSSLLSPPLLFIFSSSSPSSPLPAPSLIHSSPVIAPLCIPNLLYIFSLLFLWLLSRLGSWGSLLCYLPSQLPNLHTTDPFPSGLSLDWFHPLHLVAGLPFWLLDYIPSPWSRTTTTTTTTWWLAFGLALACSRPTPPLWESPHRIHLYFSLTSCSFANFFPHNAILYFQVLGTEVAATTACVNITCAS